MTTFEQLTTHEQKLMNGTTVTFTDVTVTKFENDPTEEWISTDDSYIIQKYTEYLSNQNQTSNVMISLKEAKEVIETAN